MLKTSWGHYHLTQALVPTIDSELCLGQEDPLKNKIGRPCPQHPVQGSWHSRRTIGAEFDGGISLLLLSAERLSVRGGAMVTGDMEMTS